MKRNVRVVLLVLCMLIALVTESGCRRSFTLEKQLVDKCKQYVEDLAAKRGEKVTEALTGDALEAWKMVGPMLLATNMTTTIKNFEGKVGQMNRAQDRAEVEATYIQEQVIEGFGTTVAEFSVVFQLKRIEQSWKIYAVQTVSKNSE